MTIPLIDKPYNAMDMHELQALLAACDKELEQAPAIYSALQATAQIKSRAMSELADRFAIGAGGKKIREKRLV